jgi:Flp pilus assembly protein TadD
VTGKLDIQRLLQTAAEHQRAGHLADAEPILRRVLNLQPRNTDGLYLLGLLTQTTGRFAESVELFQRAVHENPRSAKYLVNLGLSLGGMGLGRTREATEALRAAVAIDPGIPAAWSNLGNEFRNDFKFEEAIDAYRRALRLKPDFADAQLNLGATLQETEPALQPAIDAYRKAIALQPDLATAHWNLGFALLLSGDYEQGLPEYEWRLKTRSIVQPRNFPVPMWGGGDLAGKRILLHAEQGLGDTIHMARYIPMVAGRGAVVILECPVPLVRLLRDLPGLTQIVAGGDPLPAFDLHCPLMSLPLLFNTTLATIPWPGAYLHAEAKLSEQWSRRMPADSNSPRIGLVWAGRPENKVDRKRSMRLDQFAPLSAIRNARFFSLQKGPSASQARRPPAGMELIDYTNDLGDFTDTAAMIANLDLVVTVDTSIAHLTGALGRPAWVLLPRSPDWRWMLHRDDSPWYPALRLFRQKMRGDWEEAMNRVKVELGEAIPS